MIKLITQKNANLIQSLSESKGKIPSDKNLICITGSSDELIIVERPNVLPVVFDDETKGPRNLSFSDALRIFRFVKEKVLTTRNTTLIVTCQDGLTLSGAVCKWISCLVDPTLLDPSYYEEENLLFDPSLITIQTLQMVEYLELYASHGADTALKLLSTTSSASAETKQRCENYLNSILRSFNEK